MIAMSNTGDACDRVAVLPSALWRALDAEADIWVVETNIAEWLSQMTSDQRSLDKLTAVVRLCFEEGFYRGCLAARENKSLADSIEEAASSAAPGGA